MHTRRHSVTVDEIDHIIMRSKNIITLRSTLHTMHADIEAQQSHRKMSGHNSQV